MRPRSLVLRSDYRKIMEVKDGLEKWVAAQTLRLKGSITMIEIKDETSYTDQEPKSTTEGN